MTGGIGAPETVPADATGPVSVTGAGTADQLIVTSLGDGSSFTIDVDDEGNAQFELPPGLAAGDVIFVSDPDCPSRSVTIAIVPSSSM